MVVRHHAKPRRAPLTFDIFPLKSATALGLIFVLPANYHLRWFAVWPAKTVQKRPTDFGYIVVQNQFDCLPIRILCQLVTSVLRVAHTTSSQVHKSAGIPLEGGGELGPKHKTQSPRPSDGPSAFRYVADTVPSPKRDLFDCQFASSTIGININNKGNTDITDRSPASKYLATSSLNRFLDRFHDLFTAHGIRLIAFTYFLSFG